MSQVLFRLMGRGLFPWGGGGGWAWDLAGRFGQSANHNPSTKIHSCILTDSILSKPRRRSLCRTSAKLRELSSRLGQCNVSSEQGWPLAGPPACPGSFFPPLLSSLSVQFSRSFVSDSLRLHGLQHARPPCPSPTPRVHPNPCPLSQ